MKKLFLLLLLTASCTPTIKNFEKYQKQFINKSSFIPTQEQLDKKTVKVAVFAFDEKDIEVAKQSNLGKSLAGELETFLAKSRLAEIVDRDISSKLQQEIQLAEMNKTGAYAGPKVADYAVSGIITNADFTNKYVAGSFYINPKNGTTVTIPPKFVYKSAVNGSIKVYELPSLEVVNTIELSGLANRSENVQNNGGLSLGGLQIGGENSGGLSRDDGLVRKAASDSIAFAEAAIRNAFAKRGYILEKRSFEKKSIFKINLGSEDGIKHGDKFDVIGQYEVENSITGKAEIEKKIITSGIISNIIDPKTCFVIIDQEQKANQIRIGDMVKMKYKQSSLKSATRLVDKMI
jgi:curli biogenesis system outer membrane secretion channel CsgG